MVFDIDLQSYLQCKYPKHFDVKSTNKIILPKLLTDEMRESFRRSQEFLDLEVAQKKEEDVKVSDAIFRSGSHILEKKVVRLLK